MSWVHRPSWPPPTHESLWRRLRPFLELSIADLANYLSDFIFEVRKKDGSEFPPDSLHFCCSAQPFSTRQKYPLITWNNLFPYHFNTEIQRIPHLWRHQCWDFHSIECITGSHSQCGTFVWNYSLQKHLSSLQSIRIIYNANFRSIPPGVLIATLLCGTPLVFT